MMLSERVTHVSLCDTAPEGVDQGVELVGALLERLVRLLGEHDELGAGDQLGDLPAEPRRA